MSENIHNEANFKPEDYEVVAYLDNRPPQFCPFAGANMQEAAARFEAAREAWRQEIEFYLPGQNIHKCKHCGNTNVRYIVACKHLPSGQNVVFGDICVARLNFKNRDEFKAAQVRARAEAGNARMAAFAARAKFLKEHPELQPALDEISLPVHANNSFAKDIVAKFNQYGNLSPRQLECLVSSLQRDHEYAARKAAEVAEAKGPVPVGSRIEFAGEVVSKQWRENDFGGAFKILVKLDNNSKIWMTCPAKGVDALDRGVRASFRATVEASKEDVSFGFGSRPSLLGVVAPVGPRNNVGEGA